MEVSEHLIVFLWNFWNRKASLTIKFEEIESFKIWKAMKQARLLFLCLVSIYSENIIRKAWLENMAAGVNNWRLKLSSRYANANTLLPKTKQDREYLIKKVKQTKVKSGLKLNIKRQR